MTTPWLDPKLEKTINQVARQLSLCISKVIHRGMTEFIERLDQPNPWELGSDIFGRHASGQSNLSKNRKSWIKEKISEVATTMASVTETLHLLDCNNNAQVDFLSWLEAKAGQLRTVGYLYLFWIFQNGFRIRQITHSRRSRRGKKRT